MDNLWNTSIKHQWKCGYSLKYFNWIKVPLGICCYYRNEPRSLKNVIEKIFLEKFSILSWLCAKVSSPLQVILKKLFLEFRKESETSEFADSLSTPPKSNINMVFIFYHEMSQQGPVFIHLKFSVHLLVCNWLGGVSELSHYWS